MLQASQQTPAARRGQGLPQSIDAALPTAPGGSEVDTALTPRNANTPGSPNSLYHLTSPRSTALGREARSLLVPATVRSTPSIKGTLCAEATPSTAPTLLNAPSNSFATPVASMDSQGAPSSSARRSGRARSAPVAYWIGERPNCASLQECEPFVLAAQSPRSAAHADADKEQGDDALPLLPAEPAVSNLYADCHSPDDNDGCRDDQAADLQAAEPRSAEPARNEVRAPEPDGTAVPLRSPKALGRCRGSAQPSTPLSASHRRRSIHVAPSSVPAQARTTRSCGQQTGQTPAPQHAVTCARSAQQEQRSPHSAERPRVPPIHGVALDELVTALKRGVAVQAVPAEPAAPQCWPAKRVSQQCSTPVERPRAPETAAQRVPSPEHAGAVAAPAEPAVMQAPFLHTAQVVVDDDLCPAPASSDMPAGRRSGKSRRKPAPEATAAAERMPRARAAPSASNASARGPACSNEVRNLQRRQPIGAQPAASHQSNVSSMQGSQMGSTATGRPRRVTAAAACLRISGKLRQPASLCGGSQSAVLDGIAAAVTEAHVKHGIQPTAEAPSRAPDGSVCRPDASVQEAVSGVTSKRTRATATATGATATLGTATRGASSAQRTASRRAATRTRSAALGASQPPNFNADDLATVAAGGEQQEPNNRSGRPQSRKRSRSAVHQPDVSDAVAAGCATDAAIARAKPGKAGSTRRQASLARQSAPASSAITPAPAGAAHARHCRTVRRGSALCLEPTSGDEQLSTPRMPKRLARELSITLKCDTPTSTPRSASRSRSQQRRQSAPATSLAQSAGTRVVDAAPKRAAAAPHKRACGAAPWSSEQASPANERPLAESAQARRKQQRSAAQRSGEPAMSACTTDEPAYSTPRSTQPQARAQSKQHISRLDAQDVEPAAPAESGEQHRRARKRSKATKGRPQPAVHDHEPPSNSGHAPLEEPAAGQPGASDPMDLLSSLPATTGAGAPIARYPCCTPWAPGQARAAILARGAARGTIRPEVVAKFPANVARREQEAAQLAKQVELGAAASAGASDQAGPSAHLLQSTRQPAQPAVRLAAARSGLTSLGGQKNGRLIPASMPVAALQRAPSAGQRGSGRPASSSGGAVGAGGVSLGEPCEGWSALQLERLASAQDGSIKPNAQNFWQLVAQRVPGACMFESSIDLVCSDARIVRCPVLSLPQSGSGRLIR
jgi:hypothetical protein